MGQSKLKKVKPTVFVGARGNLYYCRNRCGRVAHWKSNNETFIERPGAWEYGWCGECKAAAQRAREERRKLEDQAKAAAVEAERTAAHVGGSLADAAAARARALQEQLEGKPI